MVNRTTTSYNPSSKKTNDGLSASLKDLITHQKQHKKQLALKPFSDVMATHDKQLVPKPLQQTPATTTMKHSSSAYLGLIRNHQPQHINVGPDLAAGNTCTSNKFAITTKQGLVNIRQASQT